MNLDSIVTPTMIVDREKVQDNISRMSIKASGQGIRFRPHFKTHQSAAVGEWFRPYGVRAITVSSLEMAVYFANHGWDDILVAFPINLRQLDVVASLAARIHLSVLVESIQSVEILGKKIAHPLDIWIKIDSGNGRTGIDWRDGERTLEILRAASHFARLTIRGLLTHAGNTYSAASIEEICQRYQASVQRMLELRAALESAGGGHMEVSVGDTPGCSLCESLGAVDEIRPGNFVFFDSMMLKLGVCRFDQVASVVACPVVALHPEREEVLIYGGAVHLSKDYFLEDGKVKHGYIVPLGPEGWGTPLEGAYMARLSQEHGIMHLPQKYSGSIAIGGLVGVVPAHVCLAVSALGRYWTTEGKEIITVNCA